MTVGMMRVKNESRWIERSIRSIEGICDEIAIFDDNSTDDTREIVRGMGATLYQSPFGTLPIDECRDKNYLLLKIEEKHVPDTIICIDGDEELIPESLPPVNELRGLAWSLRVLYLWNSPDTVRVDGVYGKFRRASIWRHKAQMRFRPTGNGANFHCGNVPAALHKSVIETQGVLLHYGYMLREDRLRKYDWYNRIDPNNRVEDQYIHMVIGDLVDRNTRAVHGGPLRLENVKCIPTVSSN